MIKLYPSHIQIHNYNIGDSNSLERSLSVWDSVTFSVAWNAMDHKENILRIPGGYSLDNLLNYFPDKEVIDKTSTYNKPKNSIFSMKYQLRDNKQRDAYNFLSGESEYFKQNKDRSQKLISLETGSGKTFITIFYISKMKVRPMIIVDSNHMIEQWKKEFLNLTDLEEDHIGIISGSDSLDTILKTPNKYKVYIASHRTLSSYSKEDHGILNDVFEKLGIGIKVFDEAHIEWKNIFVVDSNTNVKETIYLTATPNRSNPSEDKVYQNMFKDVTRYGLEFKYNNEEDNYHKVAMIEFNSNPTIKEQAEFMNRYGFDVNKWSSYMANDKYDEFLTLLEDILNLSISNGSTKIAITVKSLELVKKVSKSIKELYPDKTVGNFSGLVKDKNKRQLELKKDIIVTTDKSFDKGINVMDLEVLINTVPLSSKVKTEQLLGRLRYVEGKNTIFFDVTDMGFKSCRNQQRQRKQVYNFKAKEIFEINI